MPYESVSQSAAQANVRLQSPVWLWAHVYVVSGSRTSLGGLQFVRDAGGLPLPEDEQLGGPRLKASLILFASEECSDRARSFRKGKAESRLHGMQHSSTLRRRRSGARDASWRLAGSSCIGAKP